MPTTKQADLPLSPDEREAHAVYLRSPAARHGEPRDRAYWLGLMVELRRFPTRPHEERRAK